MKLQELDKDVLKEMSMVEVAFEIMKDERNPFDYYDLVDKVAEVKGMAKAEVKERIANLYTDMNIDGRFHSLGDNRWGLKSWYPLEQAEEEITTPVKARKKAKVTDDPAALDDGFEDYEDEYEDLEDELDEISNDDDDDEDEDDDFDDKEEIDALGDDDDEDLDEEEEEEIK